MGILKFLLIFLGIILLLRVIVRIIFPVRVFKVNNLNSTKNTSTKTNVDQPRFTIEAEEVDYEIIEEKKNEK